MSINLPQSITILAILRNIRECHIVRDSYPIRVVTRS